VEVPVTVWQPAVGERWKHRTKHPDHQDYNRIVTIVAVNGTAIIIRGKHRSTWWVADFIKHYEYLDTPPPEPEPFEQLTLDLEPLVVPTSEADATIQERFEMFHAQNPWVLRAYEKLATDWVAKGNKRLGIGMLTEIIRWQYGRQTTGSDFKLDNNFRSRYARLIMDRNPGWAGLFETRELRTP
jgi:hypothetical protein